MSARASSLRNSVRVADESGAPVNARLLNANNIPAERLLRTFNQANSFTENCACTIPQAVTPSVVVNGSIDWNWWAHIYGLGTTQACMRGQAMFWGGDSSLYKKMLILECNILTVIESQAPFELFEWQDSVGDWNISRASFPGGGIPNVGPLTWDAWWDYFQQYIRGKTSAPRVTHCRYHNCDVPFKNDVPGVGTHLLNDINWAGVPPVPQYQFHSDITVDPATNGNIPYNYRMIIKRKLKRANDFEPGDFAPEEKLFDDPNEWNTATSAATRSGPAAGHGSYYHMIVNCGKSMTSAEKCNLRIKQYVEQTCLFEEVIPGRLGID